eukprot:CAMPEP_0179009984 /NCGR_PEP_ID=MMETSP0795-20121207/16560_1 /TAXON_ID=88552 /ORGANISM="Amoebophrya sp., Strain Ameob2" /LENGTH=367 /DNA_ID=CAMNT_0020705211 /DNA_START=218 /DNA_END=1320 /DNA_ORIENTATION=-
MGDVSRAADLRELGLPPGAGSQPDSGAIRKAYFQLSLKRHPDKGGTKESFQKLSAAYERLTADDPASAYPCTPPAQGTKRTGKNYGKDYASRPSAGPWSSGHQRQGPDYFKFFRNYFANAGRSWGWDYFDAWEQEAREEQAAYARQRAENVKNHYDYRDKLYTGAKTKAGKPKDERCSFCKENAGISKRSANKHGLNYDQYAKTSRHRTCWACKNAHKSVMTENMARKNRSSDRPLPWDAFTRLPHFSHTPESARAMWTPRTSTYYWVPDLEREAARARNNDSEEPARGPSPKRRKAGAYFGDTHNAEEQRRHLCEVFDTHAKVFKQRGLNIKQVQEEVEKSLKAYCKDEHISEGVLRQVVAAMNLL